jgi:hypothetical protein
LVGTQVHGGWSFKASELAGSAISNLVPFALRNLAASIWRAETLAVRQCDVVSARAAAPHAGLRCNMSCSVATRYKLQSVRLRCNAIRSTALQHTGLHHVALGCNLPHRVAAG